MVIDLVEMSQVWSQQYGLEQRMLVRWPSEAKGVTTVKCPICGTEMKKVNGDSLASKIVNDLLFAKVIGEGVSPTEVQLVIQAQLNLDSRLREKVIHFQDNKGQSKPECHQIGKVQVIDNISEVTCLHCLMRYKLAETRQRTLEETTSTVYGLSTEIKLNWPRAICEEVVNEISKD